MKNTTTANMNRAEKRRMMKDPLRIKKLLAASEGVPEYDRIVAYGHILLYEMINIQQLMNGLWFYPKKRRAERQEYLVAQWNEASQKLEEVQSRMKEIETAAEEKKKEPPAIVLSDADKK